MIELYFSIESGFKCLLNFISYVASELVWPFRNFLCGFSNRQLVLIDQHHTKVGKGKIGLALSVSYSW